MTRDVDAAMALGYTLNRHVPSMNDKGFTVRTSYGDLVIPAGRLASHIADLVAQDARLELMRLEAASRMG